MQVRKRKLSSGSWKTSCLQTVGAILLAIFLFGDYPSIAFTRRKKWIQGEVGENDGQPLADLKDNEICPDIPTALFKYWRNKTKLEFRNLRTSSSQDITSVLRSAGVLSNSEYCYCKFVYDGQEVKNVDDLSRHCNGSGIGPSLTVRGQIYADLFTAVLQQDHRRKLGRFEFYLDLTSGTRNNVGLFKRLNIPVVSFSRNPKDSFTLPVPDAHMILGVFNDTPPFNFHKRYSPFPGSMSKIYLGYAKEWDFNWSEKIDQLIFRGGCHPTFDSDNIYPSTREELRSQLCAQYSDADPALYDIGIHLKTPPCSDLPHLDLCKVCAACDNKPRLSHKEQARYKYQLIVDGHAAANDGTAWKLLSKSANILVRPNTWDTPIFEQFYYPLLKPYIHYIPATLDEIPAAISWCKANDARCQRLGEAAHHLATCLFQPHVLEEYVFKVLKYIHDSTQKLT